MPYDPERDFAPVSLLATSPLVSAVHPSLPARNAKEFIALAKTQPGAISYASGGAGGPHHIAGEWMKMLAKIDIIHVPYRGRGPLLVDLMGGHVFSAVVALPVIAPHVKVGKVRALAVTSARRSTAFPDVPTLDESGVKGLDVTQWYGVVVPTGTSRDVITKLQADLIEVVKLPDIKARMAELGMEPVGSGSDQFGKLIRAEIVKYTKIAKEANIKID